MKPTVGRIVHYVLDRRGSAYYIADELKPYPAIITGVKEASVVDQGGTEIAGRSLEVCLHVFGVSESSQLVKSAPYSTEYKQGHWSWPPREV